MSDLELTDTAEPKTTTARKPRKAVKRVEGRTGRSAFTSPICEDHPDWEWEDGTVTVADETTHCAKFGHLPGRGRGIHQPSAFKLIGSVFKEILKPLLLLTLLVGGAYVGITTISGGGHFGSHDKSGVLRPGSELSKPVCYVSDGSQHATPRAIPCPAGITVSGTASSPASVSPHPVVTP